MKRIAYSFLLIFLLSCGSRSDLKGNRISIHFRDTLMIPHEYYLLSVRDTSLVVAPGYFDQGGTPTVIPFSKISSVYHSTDERFWYMLLGGVTGCTIADATVIAIAAHNGGGGSGEGVAFAAALLDIPAILGGMAIGCALSDDEKGYVPSSGTLKDFAKYPVIEPPELQKIK